MTGIKKYKILFTCHITIADVYNHVSFGTYYSYTNLLGTIWWRKTTFVIQNVLIKLVKWINVTKFSKWTENRVVLYTTVIRCGISVLCYCFLWISGFMDMLGVADTLDCTLYRIFPWNISFYDLYLYSMIYISSLFVNYSNFLV